MEGQQTVLLQMYLVVNCGFQVSTLIVLSYRRKQVFHDTIDKNERRGAIKLLLAAGVSRLPVPLQPLCKRTGSSYVLLFLAKINNYPKSPLHSGSDSRFCLCRVLTLLIRWSGVVFSEQVVRGEGGYAGVPPANQLVLFPPACLCTNYCFI